MNIIRARIGFCAVSALVFAVAAWHASGFQGTSRYFPEFAALAGLTVALVAAGFGLMSLRRPAEDADIDLPLGSGPQTSSPGSAAADGLWARLMAAPDSESAEFRAGFAWLAIWVGFIGLVAALGYLVGSALWLCVWFRIVHRWSFRILVPAVAIAVAALWSAKTYANVHLPGGNGFLFSLFG